MRQQRECHSKWSTWKRTLQHFQLGSSSYYFSSLSPLVLVSSAVRNKKEKFSFLLQLDFFLFKQLLLLDVEMKRDATYFKEDMSEPPTQLVEFVENVLGTKACECESLKSFFKRGHYRIFLTRSMQHRVKRWMKLKFLGHSCLKGFKNILKINKEMLGSIWIFKQSGDQTFRNCWNIN